MEATKNVTRLQWRIYPKWRQWPRAAPSAGRHFF